MEDKLRVISTTSQQIFIGKSDGTNHLREAFRVIEAPMPTDGGGMTVVQFLLPILSSDEIPIDILVADNAYSYNVDENTELSRTYSSLKAKCSGIHLATPGDLNNITMLKP